MVERALKLKQPLRSIVNADAGLVQFRISEDEWELLHDVVGLLKEARDTAFGKLRDYYTARNSACYVVGMDVFHEYLREGGALEEEGSGQQEETMELEDKFLQHMMDGGTMRTRVGDSDKPSPYLLEGVQPFVMDPLEWWKINELHYLSLAWVARDYCTILVSSVAVEQEFSGGGELVAKRRGAMTFDSQNPTGAEVKTTPPALSIVEKDAEPAREADSSGVTRALAPSSVLNRPIAGARGPQFRKLTRKVGKPLLLWTQLLTEAIAILPYWKSALQTICEKQAWMIANLEAAGPKWIGVKWKPTDTALSWALVWIQAEEESNQRLTGEDKEYTELDQLLEEWYDVHRNKELKHQNKKQAKENSVADKEYVQALLNKSCLVYKTPKQPSGTIPGGDLEKDAESNQTPLALKKTWNGLLEHGRDSALKIEWFQEEELKWKCDFMDLEAQKLQLDRTRSEEDKKDWEASQKKDKALLAALACFTSVGK
ncbi:hypothetical protein M427DRAFT_36860 [Gonapodya prolifera JEL478]|uniref:HAT C-terminal dimerisation domain-containing protein n=1 Tax=Gonapodya prolifera (strain JEL478) TaxID=1344416 RepID=A0A139A1J7_GONPJ|nr:hypothetical protein M427DRAFT_36860 [Gonapodya prolifera JEL478]|eukprot:KXS10609.1 hypothetical protein M427DRAFT_36860 [Gonapodya prolifera JEL478]